MEHGELLTRRFSDTGSWRLSVTLIRRVGHSNSVDRRESIFNYEYLREFEAKIEKVSCIAMSL